MVGVTSPTVVSDTAQIGDGVIVNADINASAAIAYSKLNLATSIVNADISASAAIVDTKLAQIATASKVSGAAITSLASVPAGAGVLPAANAPSPTNLQTTFTAGEALTALDTIVIGDDTAVKTLLDKGYTTGASNTFGQAGANVQQEAGKITIGGTGVTVSKVIVSLKKNVAPIDDAVIAIQVDSAGAPSGSDLATATIASGSLTGSMASYTLALSGSVALSASTTYWIIFRRSGSLDTTNSYGAGAQSVAGTDLYYNGTSWLANSTPSTQFQLQGPMTAGKAYRANATAAAIVAAFVGFVTATVAIEGTATVTVNGVVTGLSGLTAGTQYYLSDTNGAIATSAGTVSRKVGIALSTTTLLITNNW